MKTLPSQILTNVLLFIFTLNSLYLKLFLSALSNNKKNIGFSFPLLTMFQISERLPDWWKQNLVKKYTEIDCQFKIFYDWIIKHYLSFYINNETAFNSLIKFPFPLRPTDILIFMHVQLK